MRLSDARLQAESSTCMYSEHGLDALIRPEFGDVCQSLIVLSYWTPGSAHCQGAWAIWRMSSRASIVSPIGLPSTRAVSCQAPPRTTPLIHSVVTRTELLAFWE